jgi:phosphoribosylformylglycinamidine cyclo-ligase
LPEGLDVDIDYDSWLRPPIFGLIQKEGRVPEDDMRRTFNLGVGLVAVMPAGAVAAFSDAAVESGDQVFKIGRVVRRP